MGLQMEGRKAAPAAYYQEKVHESPQDQMDGEGEENACRDQTSQARVLQEGEQNRSERCHQAAQLCGGQGFGSRKGEEVGGGGQQQGRERVRGLENEEEDGVEGK